VDASQSLVIRHHNPSPNWRRWLTVVLISAAGVTLGAGAARAAMRRVPKRDANLNQHADAAITRHGSQASMMVLVDTAYREAYPDCPKTLDPDNAAHGDCIRKWLVVREVVAERLPPIEYAGVGGLEPMGPVGPSGTDPAAQPESTPESKPLPTTGPAAEMRGWLGSLTHTQRAELRRIVGPEYVTPIETAAAAGDDAGVMKASIELKDAGERLASDSPFTAMGRYRELKTALGSAKLDELTRLASKYKDQA